MRSIVLGVNAGCLLLAFAALHRSGGLPWSVPSAPTPVMTQATASAPAAIALHADQRGHFVTEATIDGRALRMMVDTGASLCAFSEEDATRIGLRVAPGDYTREVMTANGIVRVAPIRIGMIRIGPIVVRDVEAVVIPRGRLDTNLLGMSFLKRVRDFNLAGGRLTIRG